MSLFYRSMMQTRSRQTVKASQVLFIMKGLPSSISYEDKRLLQITQELTGGMSDVRKSTLPVCFVSFHIAPSWLEAAVSGTCTYLTYTYQQGAL